MVQAQTCSWDYLGSQGVSEGTGEWTELEYHPLNGELYMAFQDEANGSKITVMKFDGTSWSNVGAPGISAGEAYHPDLEFDSAGNLYVLYRGLPNFSYSVKTFDGTNWVYVGGADFTGSSNGAGTLAIHPLTDELYMAYPDLENSMGNRLSVRKFDGTAWNLVGPQGITATGVGYPDIQFNATGTPYVACSVFADDAKVSVLSFDGTNWNFVGTPAFTNNTSSNSSYGAALAFNPLTQEPWVATRVSGNVLDVYVYSGGVWSDETLPNYSINNFNQRLGFRFNSAGEPFVSLKRYNGSPLFVSSVVSKQNGSWDYVGNSQISEDLVTHVALTLSPEGEPVVAFRDDSPGGIGKISVTKATCTISGCTDPTACNYNMDATEDDGSCLTLLGCTDPAACNFDINAECDDSNCTYPDGCTDATAYNFDPTATCDDGSCVEAASGINFVANDDRVFIDNVDGFNASSFTVQVMYNIGSVSSYATLFHLGDAQESALEIYTQGNANLAVVVNRNNTALLSSIVATGLPNGSWTELTVTFDVNEGIKIYYNGNLANSQPVTDAPSITANTKGWIGHQPSNSWGLLSSAVGQYDELRIWNRKLSAAEIQLQSNCELDATDPDLFAYYSFNQGGLNGDNSTETTVVDQTGNGHDGILQNMALTGNSSNWSSGSTLIAGTCVALIAGCTDSNACNYNPSANIEDGSCLTIGNTCDDGDPCTENDEITADCNCAGTPLDVDDGIACTIDYCDNGVVIHMPDESLCDDGDPCTIDTCDPINGCVHTPAPDTDGDGVCDLIEVAGCTDNTAINFDPAATDDDGTCFYAGSALHFNTSGFNLDYVTVPADASHDFGDQGFTVETWFRMDFATDFSALITSFSIPNGGWALHRNNPVAGSNVIEFLVGNSASLYETVVTDPLQFNQWYHIAAVKDVGVIRLYLDGVEVGSTVSNRTLPLFDIMIGKRYVDNPQWAHQGDLDEVRVWDRALSEAEILGRMNCELNGDEEGLVRYYKFNEGIAFGDNSAITTISSDDLTNPVDGTIVGLPMTGTQGNFVIGQDLTAPCLNLVDGCLDPTACNYNDNADFQLVDCIYPSGCDICSGETDGSGTVLNGDADGDSICDVDEVAGCTDAAACNYNADATDDDGSCIVAPSIDLGEDQTVCSAQILDAGEGFDYYEWSTGETTQTIEVTSSGNYAVEAGYIAGSVTNQFSFDANENSFISHPGLPISNTYTLGAWVKFPLTGTSWKALFQKNGANHHVIISSGGDLGLFQSGFQNSGYNVNTLSGFHHVASVADQSVTTFYVDGVAVGSVPVVIAEPITSIGNYFVGSNQYAGTIDNAMVWDIALSPEQIVEFMCPPSSPQSGLLAYYTFEEGGGNTAIDESGAGNDGTIVTPNYVAETPSLSCDLLCGGTDEITFTFGVVGCTDGTACNFNPFATCDDGSCQLPIPLNLGGNQSICDGDQITLDAGPGFLSYEWSTGETTQSISVDAAGTYSVDATYGEAATANGYAANTNQNQSIQITPWNVTPAYTVGAMIEFPLPTNVVGWNTLFTPSGGVHHILINVDGSLGYFDANTGGFKPCGFNVNSLSPGFHQVAAVASSGQTTFFVDGQNVGVTAGIPGQNIRYIGNIASGMQQVGNFDNVMIWDVALTPEQITAAQCTPEPGTPGLVLYFDFEDGAIGSAIDQSGNGNDGALVGATIVAGTDDYGCTTACTLTDEVTITVNPQGCTDASACNFNPAAICDDGSCILPDGCTNPTACNYDLNALCDDGSCDFTSCIGCTDPLADNYEVDNTTDDGSCNYCPATLAFNATAAEPILIGDGISNEHMAISSNCNMSASIKAIERFTGDLIPTDGLYRVLAGESPISGVDPTPDPGKAKWNYVFSVNLGTFTAEDVKIYLDIDFDPALAAGTVFTADVTQVLIDNGLASSSLAQDSQNLGFDFWQLIGDPAIQAFDPFANGVYDLALRIETLTGVELANAPIQVEVYTLGCTDPVACNYDANATDDDGSCLNLLGCTDAGACNYDPTANCDDASCEFTSCLGCTDAASCDFDPAAIIDDGSCAIYPGDACDDGNVYTENDLIQVDCGCSGTPIDTDGDGLSDEEEITVYNTNPLLQDSDYDGLTDGLEINLAGSNPLNPDSDGDGCGDAEAFAGLCPGQEACPGDFNNDNIVNSTDLLIFLGAFGSVCN